MRVPDDPQGAFRHALSHLFARPASARVLRALALARDDEDLEPSTLTEVCALSPPAVRAALGDAVAVGLVEARGQGRIRRYRIRREHPLREPLVALYRAEEGRLGGLVAELSHAARAAAASVRPALHPGPGADLVGAWAHGAVVAGTDRAGDPLEVAFAASRGVVESLVREFRQRAAAVEERERLKISVVGKGNGEVRILAGGDMWWTRLRSHARPLLGHTPDGYAHLLRERDVLPGEEERA